MCYWHDMFVLCTRLLFTLDEETNNRFAAEETQRERESEKRKELKTVSSESLMPFSPFASQCLFMFGNGFLWQTKGMKRIKQCV